MKQQVFISRELNAESTFVKILQTLDLEAIGISLVAFKPILFDKVPECDWIFFYSKQAVCYFFENIRQQNLDFHAKLAVFGKGTAKALERELYTADFVGIGKSEETAHYFSMLAKGQTVLFPRALHSRESVQQLLQGKIKALDLVVYENTPRTDFEIPECQWLVFTSPLNANSYFQKYEWISGQKIVAIGNTTATALQQLNIKSVLIAKEPTELALAQVIRAAIQL